MKHLRSTIAEQRNVPLYCILSNDALAELAEKMPRTPAEALQIKGIGMGKITTVIPPFLDLIAKHRDSE